MVVEMNVDVESAEKMKKAQQRASGWMDGSTRRRVMIKRRK